MNIKLVKANFARAIFVKSTAKVARLAGVAIGLLFLGMALTPPAFAHHALGGNLPANGFEGFISGLAHPIIGLDHFAFVVAIGLLAAIKRQGVWLPLGFVVATLMGTGIHLLSFDLPIPEIVVSASVLTIGIMLAMQNSPNFLSLLCLSTIAGLFHGYAYAESIIGAEMSPLVAYLLGFTTIQFGIAMIARWVGKRILQRPTILGLRWVGFVLCGAGVVFLSTAIFG